MPPSRQDIDLEIARAQMACWRGRLTWWLMILAFRNKR